MLPRIRLPLCLLVVFTPGTIVLAAAPSFDCAKASGAAEELVCSDEGLAELDRKLAEVYATAMTNFEPDEATLQKGIERGWIKGRDDCWKSEDLRDCIEASYQTRIVELQVHSGQLEAPEARGYRCEGNEETPFFANFYDETEPPSAVITFGDDQVIAFRTSGGGPATYTADNMSFTEEAGVAVVDWYGADWHCALMD